MSNHEHKPLDTHALRRSLRRWRFAAATLGCALVAVVGVGMAQGGDDEPTVVGFGVSDQASGRVDDTFYRLMSDGTVHELDTTRAEPEWKPAQGLQRIRN